MNDKVREALSALDEKAVVAACEAYHADLPHHDYPSGWAMEQAIRAYLASVSPAVPDALIALAKERDEAREHIRKQAEDIMTLGQQVGLAEKDRDAARQNFHLMQNTAAKIQAAREAAEALVASLKARLEEALRALDAQEKQG